MDRKTRVCLVCNNPISTSKRIDAKYCSTKCGNRARCKKFSDLNPKKMAEYRVTENNKVQSRIYSRIKSRSKIRNIPFDLEIEDIVVPDFCPVLGIKIKSVAGSGTNFKNSPSVDRIDPNRGYTKDNIRIISNRANLLKSNATVEEMEKILADIKKIRLEKTLKGLSNLI